MKLILEYQGTVSISGNNVQVAGYLTNEDPGKLAENLAALLTTFSMDSSELSVPVDNPAVMLSIELGPLTVPPSPSASKGNGSNSPSPTTTPSGRPTPPAGTGSQASSGKMDGSGRPVR